MTLGSLSRGDPATVGHQGRLHQLPLRRRKENVYDGPGESQSWRPCNSWLSGAAASAPLAQAEVTADASELWALYDGNVLLQEAQFGS